jgi:3-hydroxyisobutyrate dehydrogenase-like beta-hydroxyacid dehydrogenase
VTVWNRSLAKAEALAGPGVHVAPSVAEACESSPLSIVSVADQEVGRALVEAADVDLGGKVVASTSFVTPDQARAYASVVGAPGGIYLDLEIVAYPSQVRSGAGYFHISGDRRAFEAHRQWFERMGRVIYVSDVPAAAFSSAFAVLAGYFPMAVGLLQGLDIARQEGLSPEWFKEAVLELFPFHIETLLDRVIAGSGEVEASVDVMAAAAAEYGGALREMGLDPGMYDALQRLFVRVSEAGHGDADWTCVSKHAT